MGRNSLERWKYNFGRRWCSNDFAHGFAILDALIYCLFWPRFCVCSCHVLSWFLSFVGLLHVCQKRLQIAFETKCFRNWNPLGYASCHFYCWSHGYGHGIDHQDHLWPLVSLLSQSSGKLKNNIIFTYRAMCSDLVYVILFPQLLIVVHFKDWVNTYGSLSAYCIGLFFR